MKQVIRFMQVWLLVLMVFTISIGFASSVKGQTSGVWTQVATTGPSPRYNLAMSYDSVREVTVLFGGFSTTPVISVLGDTWEWDGTNWNQVSTIGPSPRYSNGLAYDSIRGVTVLFGGFNRVASLGDTWEWNGTSWNQVSTAGPPARLGHAMAYDSVRGVTVLFGGFNSNNGYYLNDTWEWDGSNWKQVAATGPSARRPHTMSYDSARGVTVLFGGYDGNYLGDTWEWDGSNWKQVAVTGPSARGSHQLVYDSARRLTVLFGGYSGGGLSDTWEWNGIKWKQVTTMVTLQRGDHGMAYDSKREVTVLFGGYESSIGPKGETWEYIGPKINNTPIANAGLDQSVFIDNTVALDGSGSSDVDGDLLTYNWTFTQKPDGSTATLNNPTSVNPTYVVDVAGTYTISLIVNDGNADSVSDTVTISASTMSSSDIDVILDTVDQTGSHVAGYVSTTTDGYNSAQAPATTTMANGGRILMQANWGGLGVSMYLTINKDTTYWLDSLTGIVTSSESTPGVNKVNFVFEQINVTLDTEDQTGSHVAGSVSTTTDGYNSAQAPATTTMANGGRILMQANWGGLGVSMYLTINKDTTYWLDSLTGTVTSSESTPGVNKVNFVFEQINVTLDTEDQTGSHVAGSVSTTTDGYNSAQAPATTTMANGGRILMQASWGGLGVSMYLTINKDTTYWVDSTTGTVTRSESTSGVNKVIFVFVVTNTAPVANAGTDQSVYVGNTVTLDGSGSSDVDGNALTYSWILTSKPTNSTAALINSTSANPTFTIDIPGTYVASLTVNDGTQDSASDTVTITTLNSVPVANAGADQSVYVGNTVTLNGGNSSDVDGNTITYSWTISSKPENSAAALTDATSVSPTFTADKFGTYVVSLTVNDGTVNSDADTVTITTQNSAPVAVAGADQSVYVGNTVTLDGSESTDVDGDTLTYSWAFTSKPTDSTATLSAANVVNPTFTVDKAGTYVLSLVVNDGTVDSALDTVTISTLNSAPVANAGADQSPYVTEVVTLNGGGSTDVDGNLLTYTWAFTSKPMDSAATLSDAAAVNPTFTVDKAGTYELSLVVNDGTVDSSLDTVTISTLNSAPVANAGTDQSPYVTETVTLNGGGSTDVDGNLLTYTWAFTSKSDGSTATLSDAAAVNPTFTVDKAGTYVVSLFVNDGTVNSETDTVTISTLNSAPVASAGTDQSVYVNDTVTLDGSGSSDVDGNLLTYSWAFTTKPDGSTATLSDATDVNPTFTVDKAGTYVVSLFVNDGTVNSETDTVTISTLNSAPVASAGADQSVYVNDTVTLDGSGSSDVDGNLLTYSWAFTTKPDGSEATLSDTAAMNPTFAVDKAGTYVVSLFVNDGTVNSETDTVTISTLNSAPVASAGADQSVYVNDTVTLDGSGSSDVDGNLLTYSWAFTTKPDGSTATLSDAASVNPTFTVDKAGTYVVSLFVNDGTVNSETDTLTISTLNVAPVASAGTDQSITVIGTTVLLDGSQSYDPDGDSITYQWSFISIPSGSNASLANGDTTSPTFVADVNGEYVAQLIVGDASTQSVPDTITVSFENIKPVANAGTGQSVTVGDTVTIDGSGSTDANGDALTYQWTLTSAPSGSTASMADTSASITSFVPDVAGMYVAQLVVNDGTVNSDPSTVQIQAVDVATSAIQAMQDCQTQIASLDPSVFKNANMQNTMINKLNAVIANIEAGSYEEALGQLENDVLKKTDGCATEGAPDKNDWIKNCDAQGSVYPCLLHSIELVEALM